MPNDILQRLETIVKPTASWSDIFWARSTAPFEGKIISKSFVIQRVIITRNSYLPQIVGRIRSDQDQRGSIVFLCHRLRWAILVLNSLWLVVVGFVTLLVGYFTSATSSLFWILLGFFALSATLFTVPFWLEVRKSRPMLIKMLELQAVSKR